MTTDTVGGVWSFTGELVTGLLQRACCVTLASLGRDPSLSQNHWARKTRDTYPDHFRYVPLSYPLEWMPDNQCAYVQPALALQTLARELKPDFLHANQYCFGRLQVSAPTLITAHSDVLSWANACDQVLSTTDKWLSTYSHLVHNGLIAAHAVVAPTHWMLNALASNYQLPHSQYIIPNGHTTPHVDQKGVRRLQAVTAGRLWDPAKGVSILEEVDSPFPLLLAGETAFGRIGTDPASQMRSLGALGHHELLALFCQSSIYLCTSLYEPFGLAPLEAAQCGCAVVARDIPSLREVWGENALYYSDASELSALLRALYEDPLLLAQVRAQSEKHSKHYTSIKMTDAYLALYENLIAQYAGLHHVA